MRIDQLWPSAQTEAWIQAPARVFEDQGSVGVIRTLSNPTYRWGNCLVLAAPPEGDTLPSLEALHRQHFPTADRLGQVPAFYWPADRVAAALEAALVDRGYAIEVEAPLRATNRQAAPELPDHIDVVPVRSPAQWRALVDFRLRLYPDLSVDFMLHRLGDAWKTAQILKGDWWVIQDNGAVVGSMGLFWQNGLARYQDVDIQPDRQGQGLGRLMFQTVRARSEASGAFDAQIIVADRGSLAHGWYQRMGFSPIQGEVFAFRKAANTRRAEANPQPVA